VVVEIYTAIAAMAGGRTAARSKMKTVVELDAALAEIGSPPVGGAGTIDDHSADALVTAAWLRVASGSEALWRPRGMTAAIAKTEGWTFGAR
jgi:hypothetical protein